jgi:hypothetical protein
MYAANKARPAKRATEDDLTYLAPDERPAKGQALREAIPRASHAGWKPPKGRHDPIETLTASNKGRLASLIPIRFGRMAQSPFAFLRGSAAVMAADLAHTAVSGIRAYTFRTRHL